MRIPVSQPIEKCVCRRSAASTRLQPGLGSDPLAGDKRLAKRPDSRTGLKEIMPPFAVVKVTISPAFEENRDQHQRQTQQQRAVGGLARAEGERRQRSGSWCAPFEKVHRTHRLNLRFKPRTPAVGRLSPSGWPFSLDGSSNDTTAARRGRGTQPPRRPRTRVRTPRGQP
jgi:hypothetical protein